MNVSTKLPWASSTDGHHAYLYGDGYPSIPLAATLNGGTEAEMAVAEQIVRAVNAYDALLAACEYVLAHVALHSNTHRVLADAVQKARGEA